MEVILELHINVKVKFLQVGIILFEGSGQTCSKYSK